MHCPNCGQKTSAELKFCRSCGMKLGAVAQALSEHVGAGKIVDPSEEKRSVRILVTVLFFGFFLVFAGAITAVLGKGNDSIKITGAILALVGVFVAILGALLPVIIAAFGKETSPVKTTEEIDAVTGMALPSGDDFEPVSSVTESTTRELDKNKTKIFN